MKAKTIRTEDTMLNRLLQEPSRNVVIQILLSGLRLEEKP